MAVIQIIDAKGEWVHNPRAFAFCDPETGVNYQSGGHFYKVVVGEKSWLEAQLDAGVLKRCDDPTADAAPGPEPAAKGGRKK